VGALSPSRCTAAHELVVRIHFYVGHRLYVGHRAIYGDIYECVPYMETYMYVCHIWRHICMCAIYGTRTYMHYPESGTYCVPYMETYMYVYYISMRAIYSTHTLHVYICLRPLDAHNGAAYIHIMCIDVSFVGLYISKETYKRALQRRPTSHHARCTQWSGIHTHHVYR